MIETLEITKTELNRSKYVDTKKLIENASEPVFIN